MTKHSSSIPDFMPTLSAGRHRNPRKGACFMEMASYLAGERWSDHPRCTHPLLAAMARETNDRLGDDARQDLAPLIPSVVGLTGDDPRIGAWIAREAALTALPVVAMSRQRSLAVGVLRSEAFLDSLDGLPPGWLSPRARRTLALVPEADQWAREFIGLTSSRRDAFLSRGAPAVVHQAVAGIAQSCTPDSAPVLVDLLRRTITKLGQLNERPAGHDPHRVGASALTTVVPAGDSGRNLPPSAPSESMSRALDPPVSANGRREVPMVSAVRWDTSG